MVVEKLAADLGCAHITHRPEVAKLSVSGIGLRSHTSVAIRMFRALADAEINIDLIGTSEVQVTVVVDRKHGNVGLEKLQAAFSDVLR
jgi:aspartate kinase